MIKFSNVPKGWLVEDISKVLFFQEGPGVRKWQFQDEGVKLLNVGNINQGNLTLSSTKIYLSEEEANGKYSHFLVDEGDLLIACSGIVVSNFHNKITFAKREHLPLCMNTSTMRFKTLDETKLCLNFFKYFLQTNSFVSQLRKLITGSAQLNFGPSHIKKMAVCFPSLDEQKKITKVLDAADRLRQKDQQLVEHYDRLSQSLFLDMFGVPAQNIHQFEVGTIRELVSSVNYGTSAKAQTNGEYAYLRMNNITYQGYMDYESLKYIDLSEKDKEKYLAKKGDILFNRTNSKELVGKTGLFDEDEEMALAGYLIRVRTNNKANPYYLWRFMNTAYCKTVLTHMCKSIVGMANINAQEFQNIKILIPPIEVQNLFEQKSRQIEEQKKLAQESLKKSDDLFNSLLQKAFKGELTAS